MKVLSPEFCFPQTEFLDTAAREGSIPKVQPSFVEKL